MAITRLSTRTSVDSQPYRSSRVFHRVRRAFSDALPATPVSSAGSSTPDPTSVLPFELLSDIFLLAVPRPSFPPPPDLIQLRGNISRVELALSHVCSRWAGVAAGTPALWSAVFVRLHRTMGRKRRSAVQREMAQLYVQRARGLQLDVVLYTTTKGEGLSNVDALWALPLLASQARTLTLLMRGEELSPLFSLFPPISTLRTLTLYGRSMTFPAGAPLAMDDFPSLTRVRVRGVPLARLPASSKLESLDYHQPRGFTVTLAALRSALAADTLTHLALRHCVFIDRSTTTDSTLICLPVLKSLTLEGGSAPFEYMHAPALVELRLSDAGLSFATLERHLRTLPAQLKRLQLCFNYHTCHFDRLFALLPDLRYGGAVLTLEHSVERGAPRMVVLSLSLVRPPHTVRLEFTDAGGLFSLPPYYAALSLRGQVRARETTLRKIADVGIVLTRVSWETFRDAFQVVEDDEDIQAVRMA